MTDSTKKKVDLEQIKIHPDLKRKIKMEAVRLGMFEYQVIEKLSNAYDAAGGYAKVPELSETELATSEDLSKTLGTSVKSPPAVSSAIQIDVAEYTNKLEQARQLIGIVVDGLSGGVAVEAVPPKPKPLDINAARDFPARTRRSVREAAADKPTSRPSGGARGRSPGKVGDAGG